MRLVLDRLEQFYGVQPPVPADPFAVYVWELLGLHTIDTRRDAAFAALRKARALTPDSLVRLAPAKLEAAVALAGPFKDERLRFLRQAVEIFRRQPEAGQHVRGRLGIARRFVHELPGLGRTGARRVLLFAGNHPVVPADAEITRVALRLQYGDDLPTQRATVRSVQHALQVALPREAGAIQRAVLLLHRHGATTCEETRPRCRICPVVGECGYAYKNL